MEPVYTPVIATARLIFAVQGLRFQLSGTEHIPRTGGGVLMINHTGYMDFTYAGLAALPAKRYVRFMAKEAVFRHWASGPLVRGMKHIPVDRSAGAASFRLAVEALKAGELVGVFPEATISRSFELKGFKTGGVRMAQAAGVPIIPVVIWGAQRVWTKGYPKRLGRTNVPIHLQVGAPIAVERSENADAATARVKAVMAQMLLALQEGYPPIPEHDAHLVPRRLGGTAPTLSEADALDHPSAQ